MRLYGAIQKVEPQDDVTVRVHGIATSEAVDDQGEIVRADAIRAAIPDYMRFPALREMHQLSAAGTTLEAEVGENGTTRIVAHVVDPVAVAKVKNQVYRGFSIGGRVTQREPGNPKAITGLVLNEISLVDRPANPEAIFDCWKASIMSDAQMGESDLSDLTSEPSTSAQALLTPEAFNSPIQIWACGVADHRHLAKADALKCVEKRTTGPIEAKTAIATAAMAKAEGGPTTPNREDREEPRINPVDRGKPVRDGEYADPGYQSDGNADRHIRVAWKEKIRKHSRPSANDGEKASPTALTKTLWDVGHVARLLLDLDWLKDALDLEMAMEGDDSPQPSRLQAIVAELCSFLSALVTETGENLSGAEMEGGPPAPAAPGMLGSAAGVSGIARVAALLKNGNPNMRKLATGLLAKAKHSQGDQARVDVAHHACDKCLEIGGLSIEERELIGKARDHLLHAGAAPTVALSADKTDDVENFAPETELPIIDNATMDTSKSQPAGMDPGVLDAITAALGKRGLVHQHMMDVAHDCVRELTERTTCGEAPKAGARHSRETMDHFNAAHRYLVAAGARCGTAGMLGSNPLTEEEHQGTEFAPGRSVRTGDLAKALAGERAEKAALVRALGEMVPMLDRLTKRVEDIARTPMPPLTIAKGTISVSKQQDGSGARSGDPELSPEAVASALAKMSKEEQTLTLIKASYANPIRMLRIPEGER